MSLPDHLGGHKNKTHLDRANLEHMITKYGIETMLDIGCGPGGMVGLAQTMGVDAQGIDGDFEVPREVNIPVTIHDYTTGPSPLDCQVDFAWSCEFVEHVYEEFLPNYMQDFQRARFVIMTYAPPGKPGHHHVNCRPESYWVEIFDQYGFDLDHEETEFIRENSSMFTRKVNKRTGEERLKHQFVKHHGLFFTRR